MDLHVFSVPLLFTYKNSLWHETKMVVLMYYALEQSSAVAWLVERYTGDRRVVSSSLTTGGSESVLCH